MRRWSFRVLAVLTCLTALVMTSVAYLGWASLPQTEGDLGLVGITAPVSVTRDEFGIPTIRAANLSDLYAGLGFAHAQDRLWQMEFSRRLGQGRLSEILGEDALGIDRFMRTLGLYRVAEGTLAHLNDQTRAWLESYADGVNGLLNNRSGPLPPEFQILQVEPEPWLPADSIVMAKLLALDLSKNWRDEAARLRLSRAPVSVDLDDLWPGAPPLLPLSGLDDTLLDLPMPAANSGLGSNIWAVTGSGSASGEALLANDPHLRMQAPGTWYLARLVAPGLRAVGATIPAMPAMVIGRNEALAWGFTNSGADVQDLFVETLDAGDPERYLTPTGPMPFERRVERILIKDGEVEELVVRETRHGPVISDLIGDLAAADTVVALAWTSLAQDDRTLEAGFELALADDWPTFKAAIERFDSPPQNAFYADRQGRIGSLLAGRIPVRQGGDGRQPQDGASGAFDWTGYLSSSDKPFSLDPVGGRLANANNRVVDDDYPHLLTKDWDPDDRYRRIAAQLSAKPHGLVDAKALQNDAHSTLADDFLWLLTDAKGQHEAIDALLSWDRAMTADRPEPLILQAWYLQMVEAVFADDLKESWRDFAGMRTEALMHVTTNAEHWCDDSRTEVVEDCRDIAWQAFEETMAELNSRHGADWRAWRWGEVSAVHMAHQPFSRVPVLNRLFDIRAEKAGGPTSPNVSSFSTSTPFSTIAAASMRMIMDWRDPEAIHFMTATGQSGHPLSSHYRDMTTRWVHGDYLRLLLPTQNFDELNVDSGHQQLNLIPTSSHFASRG